MSTTSPANSTVYEQLPPSSASCADLTARPPRIGDRTVDTYYVNSKNPHNLAGFYEIQTRPASIHFEDNGETMEYWHSTLVFRVRYGEKVHTYPTPFVAAPDFALHARHPGDEVADANSRERARRASSIAWERYGDYYDKANVRWEIVHMLEMEKFEASAGFRGMFTFPVLPPANFARSHGMKLLSDHHRDEQSQAVIKLEIAKRDKRDKEDEEGGWADIFPMSDS